MKDDLVYRQAVIEALLKKGQCSRRYKLGDIWELDFDEIREAMATVPSAEPERWIPCSKHLPMHERRTYWVCTDAGTQHECRWLNDVFGMGVSDTWGWSIFDIPQYTKVVAWKPLPEPWKGGQDE